MRRLFLTAAVVAAAIPAFVSGVASAEQEPAQPEPTVGWGEPLFYDAPTTDLAPFFQPAQVPLVSPIGASRYQSVAPDRILDTRIGLGAPRNPVANRTITLPIVGKAGVPAGATAVVMNLTVTGTRGPGYVTAYPSGIAPSTTSVINYEFIGQTIANLVTVPIGADGAVNLFMFEGTDLIADVQGYYVPAASSRQGRLQPINPTRLLDTRGPGGSKVAPGGTITLDVAATAGLAPDTDSAALNITVTNATAAGFWTVYPAGGAFPPVSNLNVARAGSTVANQAIVPLSNGKISIFSERGGDVIVDIVGAFGGPSAPLSSDGLFVPVRPDRLVDSRAGFTQPGYRRTIEVPVAGRFGVPTTGVAAVVVNVTAAEAIDGYVSVWPARNYRPNASSLNISAPVATVAGHVITPVSSGGIAVFTNEGADLLVDVSGWFTGSDTVGPLPPHIPLTPAFGPTGPGSYGYSVAEDPANFYRDFVNPPSSVTPARWDPCRSIRYVVNYNGYDRGRVSAIEEAIDRVSSATGQAFFNVGETTHMPTLQNPFQFQIRDGYDERTPYDLVIALGSESVTDVVNGGVIGVATTPWYQFRDRLSRLFMSAIVLDMGDIEFYEGRGDADVFLKVLQHELGHTMGLSHVADEAQIMAPFVSDIRTFQTGDLKGLWELGTVRGCTFD